jgi:hypothetical protein
MNKMTDDRRRQVENLIVTVQQAFLDAPALRLTLPDAQQRFAEGANTCEAVLNLLVDAGVLARTTQGQYAREFPLATRRAA